jgi:hypothetical protein
MGTTLWVLSREKMAEVDDWDHSAIFNAVEKLDLVCEKLRVTKLSSFLDWTDFNANMAADEEFPSDDELKAKASWFRPDAALPTLRALRGHLADHPAELSSLYDQSQGHLSEYLIEELDDCIAKVEKIAVDGDEFHLCVVM